MSQPTYLDCKSAYLRLNDFLDRELSPEDVELVKAHLSKCRVCAMEFEFEASLLTQLKMKVCQGQAPDELKAAIKGILAQARTQNP